MTARRDNLIGAVLVVCVSAAAFGADPPAPADNAPPAPPPAAGAPVDLAHVAKLFDEKKYDDALAALGSPGNELPTSPYEALAKGTTLAAASKLNDAAQVLQGLSASATDASVAQRARFNLGSVLMKQSEAAPPDKLDDKMKLVSQAADQFLAAARLDPADLDAVRNLENARRELADLEKQKQEHQKQQQQQQQQNKDQNQNQDQQQQQGDQQNQEGQQGDQQNQDQNQQNQQSQQSTESPQSKAQQAAKDLQDQAQKQAEESMQNQQGQQSSEQGEKDQTDLNEQSKQSQADLEELAKQQQNDKGSEQTRENIKQAQDALERARQAQEDAKKALEKGDQQEAAQKQHEAAQALSEAASNAQQAADAAGAEAQAQIDPLIQQLLDREKAYRAQRAKALKGTPVPVDKDW